MTTFLMVLVVAVAFVAGAWLRLGPSPEERRRGRLRAQAMAAGYRVRYVDAGERAGLGIPEGCWWYVLPRVDESRAEQDLVRFAGTWRSPGSDAEVPGPPVPPGVAAVRLGPEGVALAWSEAAAEPLDAVLAALDSLAG